MFLIKITDGRVFEPFIRSPIDWISGFYSAIESCSTSPINSLASQCVCLPNNSYFVLNEEPHQKRDEKKYKKNRYHQKRNSIAWSRGEPRCCRNKWHSHLAVFFIKMPNKSVIRCFCFVYRVCAMWCESIASFLLLLHIVRISLGLRLWPEFVA